MNLREEIEAINRQTRTLQRISAELTEEREEQNQAEQLTAEFQEWAQDAKAVAEWEAWNLNRLIAEQDAEGIAER